MVHTAQLEKSVEINNQVNTKWQFLCWEKSFL